MLFRNTNYICCNSQKILLILESNVPVIVYNMVNIVHLSTNQDANVFSSYHHSHTKENSLETA